MLKSQDRNAYRTGGIPVRRDIRRNQVVYLKGRNEKLDVSRSFNHLFKQM